MKLIRKALGAWKLYKFGLFRILLNRLSPEIFACQTFVLFRHDLKKEKISVRQNNEPFVIKKMHNHQEKLFKQFRKKFPNQEFVHRIKQPNKTCYVILKDKQVAGYGWVSDRELSINSINYTYPLKKDEIFIYACFVCKEYRGEGMYPSMLQRILSDYSKQGYRLAYIGVLSFNRGSIRGVKKAGFKEVNKIRYLRLLNKEKWWGLGRYKYQHQEKLRLLFQVS
ncbi:MAG TPA: GNAT family N-acetyltransferase [Balneolaceae bacterium]